jgi:hypothetical protein
MPTTSSTEEISKAKYKVPLNSDKKKPILLNVEEGVSEILKAIAKRETIKGAEGINTEILENMPDSITGVAMYLLVAGLKTELNICFDNNPKSIKKRGNAARNRKIAGKKRLLTREEKNELLEQTQMSFYEGQISSGIITIEDAMKSIREKYTKKKEYEDMGYILPAGKTKYPYWAEEEIK